MATDKADATLTLHIEPEVDIAKTEAVLARHADHREALIRALQDVQAAHNYLPREALELTADRLGVPMSDVLRVATFYRAFSLEPRGRHCINVCMGTACHVRGGDKILERLQRDLGIQPGETTPELLFSLEVVRCIGCCSMAPAVRIDNATYGRLRQDQMARIVRRYRREAGRA